MAHVRRLEGAALALVVIAAGAAAPAPVTAQDSPAAQEADTYAGAPVDLEEIVVVARRRGADPSAATTECLWDQLTPDERAPLTAVARRAVSTLARHDTVPLANPAVSEAAAGRALELCGGQAEPEHLRFARVALAAYAVERESLVDLRRHRIDRARLMRGWSALNAAERDALLAVAANPEDDPENAGVFVRAVFKVLGAMRPVSTYNPLAYRQGSPNHRALFLAEAYAARVGMERRF